MEKKIRCLIIDDEEHSIKNLDALLKKHCPEVVVLGSATNVDAGLELILHHTPDLLFLDIQMPGKDGFELLKNLPQDRDIEIIFATAYDQYGIKAIKFSATDYLLKPIDPSELNIAVQKVIKRLDNKQKNLRFNHLTHLLAQQTDHPSPQIALPSLLETRLVPIYDIIRCQASNNYTTFHLSSGEELIISKPIYEYDELLSEFGFIRCHQSHLINKKHVLSYSKKKDGYLVTQAGDKVPVARRRKDAVYIALKENH